MADAKYPSPEQISIPLSDDISPDQEYAVGWAVQHNRLFVLLIFSVALNVLLALWGVFAAKSHKPAVQLVTLEGGRILVYGEGQAQLDGVAYNPSRLRRVVSEYLESRFAYDYQNPGKLNSLRRLLSNEAYERERTRLTPEFIQNSIMSPQLRVRLELDLDKMTITPKQAGELEVKVPALVFFTDAVRYPDPAMPRQEQRSFVLTVKVGQPTNENPDGYVITAIPEDILQGSSSS